MGSARSKDTVLVKRCPKCEKDKETSEFYKSKSTKDGYRCYCKPCEKTLNSAREGRYFETRKAYRQTEKYKQIKRDYYKSNTEDILQSNRKWRETVKGRYSSYKRGAESRGLPFDLSLEDFCCIYEIPCYYCGVEFEGVGIDRLDNSLGYIKGNMVSCCTQCNTMKMDYNLKDFLDKVELIYYNLLNNAKEDK